MARVHVGHRHEHASPVDCDRPTLSVLDVVLKRRQAAVEFRMIGVRRAEAKSNAIAAAQGHGWMNLCGRADRKFLAPFVMTLVTALISNADGSGSNGMVDLDPMRRCP